MPPVACNCLIELLLQFQLFSLIDHDLGFQVLGLSLIPFGDLTVSVLELALDVGVLVVLGQATLV